MGAHEPWARAPFPSHCLPSVGWGSQTVRLVMTRLMPPPPVLQHALSPNDWSRRPGYGPGAAAPSEGPSGSGAGRERAETGWTSGRSNRDVTGPFTTFWSGSYANPLILPQRSHLTEMLSTLSDFLLTSSSSEPQNSFLWQLEQRKSPNATSVTWRLRSIRV